MREGLTTDFNGTVFEVDKPNYPHGMEEIMQSSLKFSVSKQATITAMETTRLNQPHTPELSDQTTPESKKPVEDRIIP